MLVIRRIWKQFYVDPLPGSTQNWGNRMEKARGLFMELSSWKKFALQAGGCRGLTAGTWWQAPGEPKAVVVPGNVTCGTCLSSLQMDGFVVCAAQSRAAWQGAASPSPPQAWVSGYFVHELWKSLSRSWLCGKHERWGANTSHQAGAQQCFSCSLGLCCASYMYTGNSLSARSRQEENKPISSVYSLCAQKEIVKWCCQNLLSKHSF